MFFSAPKIFSNLNTPRMILREPRSGDVDDIFAFCSKEESCRYVDWTPHANKKESKDFIMYLKRQMYAYNTKSYTWFAEHKISRRVIATVSLVETDYSGKIATVGYTFSEEFQHKGYATEAMLRVMHYLFSEKAVERIEAKVLPANFPSLRLLERLGMQREGLLRKGVFCKTALADVYVYSILKNEFYKKFSNPSEVLNQFVTK